MEIEVANMRFVRCPKCSKLLPEFSSVPMYQCGGCNAILQDFQSTILLYENYSVELLWVFALLVIDLTQVSFVIHAVKHCTSNYEKPVIESSETNFYHEEDESSDVALEISSVFSFNIKDENWSYKDDSMSSSFENSSQTSADKSYLGSLNRKERNDSLMQNLSPDRENEDSRNSFSAWNQNSKSISQFIDLGVRSSNSSISAGNRTSKTSLDSESFYSVGSRIEDENEEGLLDSPSTSLNNRMELLRTVEKLTNQIEAVFKTVEQNGRMDKFLTENANSGSSKRYVLPVSKGAPFVICNKCFELLHIPLNLRIISKGFNKLKCSSCLEVLRLQFPSRCAEKLLVSKESGVNAEAVDSISVENEASACESSGAEIEPELQATNDPPEVKYTLHQLMGYMSARMLLQ